jgi:SAM-dependent methyltransferase
MEERQETWDSFWAQTLRIDFFEGQWEPYRRVADARAEWLELTFGLDASRPVLSCACGEGGIELALARRGFQVTGIDKCPAFIHFAREQAAKEGLVATFLVADLRVSAPSGGMPLPGGNGTVCCFDTLGLLATEDEEALLGRMARALGPSGVLLADCPKREEQSSQRTWWKLRDGYLLQDTRWDKGTSTLLIEPVFLGEDGARVLLADPYDQTRAMHTGVQRYVYTPEEVARLVRSAGLHAEVLPHQRKGYALVAGREGYFEV